MDQNQPSHSRNHQLLVVIVILIIIGVYYGWTNNRSHSGKYDSSSAYSDSYSTDSSTNTASAYTCFSDVAYVPIIGEIYSSQDQDMTQSSSYSEAGVDSVVGSLIEAGNNPDISAIVLVIDSGGGSPEATDEILEAMASIHKPIYSIIRGQGASAAYRIAAASNAIYAYPSSEIGSIGVTDSYLSHDKQNADKGLQFVSLSSGPYKDTSNPDKPITDADKKLIMRDVKVLYDIFVNEIAKNRGLSTSTVYTIADGSTMLGDMALQNGLIDNVGGWNALQAKLESSLNEHSDKLCTF